MKQLVRDPRIKFNIKIKENANNSFQKFNNLEVNSVSSNEDNDFIMPVISDSLLKKIDKTRSHKQSKSSIDLQSIQDNTPTNTSTSSVSNAGTTPKSFRVRKLSKDSILAPINIGQNKSYILPTPKSLALGKTATTTATNTSSVAAKKKQPGELFGSISLSEFSQSNKQPTEPIKSKLKSSSTKSIDSGNSVSLPVTDSFQGTSLSKVATNNKENLVSKKSPPLKSSDNEKLKSSILSFNLQPIKAAALNKLQSTSELISTNLSPAFDTFFFPKIHSPNMAQKASEKKSSPQGFSANILPKANPLKFELNHEEFEDLDLNAILYSDVPDIYANDYFRTRLSKINEETSGKNTRMSQNWSTWSGISSALSEIENQNFIVDEMPKKKTNSVIHLSRPIHQRAKTFYHYENTYA